MIDIFNGFIFVHQFFISDISIMFDHPLQNCQTNGKHAPNMVKQGWLKPLKIVKNDDLRHQHTDQKC